MFKNDDDIQRAHTQKNLGNYTEAISLYIKYYERTQRPSGLIFAANCNIKRCDYRSALEIYEKLFRDDPRELSEDHNILIYSKCLLEERNYQKAFDLLYQLKARLGSRAFMSSVTYLGGKISASDMLERAKVEIGNK